MRFRTIFDIYWLKVNGFGRKIRMGVYWLKVNGFDRKIRMGDIYISPITH